ncbi:hypothetical protein E2C01_034882 [Portunus trituberculatus]|uniref:Uncharacterized protein n=1 Tax=Portunus trituberculatus TaxID=210409 RepID=A0A5B7F9Y8_PORTR|nr:hypothetical protein [Portunus trituberculatus]
MLPCPFPEKSLLRACSRAECTAVIHSDTLSGGKERDVVKEWWEGRKKDAAKGANYRSQTEQMNKGLDSPFIRG